MLTLPPGKHTPQPRASATGLTFHSQAVGQIRSYYGHGQRRDFGEASRQRQAEGSQGDAPPPPPPPISPSSPLSTTIAEETRNEIQYRIRNCLKVCCGVCGARAVGTRRRCQDDRGFGQGPEISAGGSKGRRLPRSSSRSRTWKRRRSNSRAKRCSSKVIKPNAEVVVKVKPQKPGRYVFFDDLHPETKGTLVVE